MEFMERLKGMLMDSLEEIVNRGVLSAADLEAVHKLTDTIKNVCKIMYIDENGYSMDGGWTAEGYYDRGNSRNSYAGRMGTHYVRGHYSRDDRSYNMMNSRAAMADEMEEVMRNGNMTANEKQIMQKAMELMRR